MTKNKWYYVILAIVIGAVVGFLSYQFFFSQVPEPPQVEQIEKMIISQDEIREQAKKVVEQEVRRIHEQVSKEVDALTDDELSVALNAELARFRQLSSD